jgi:hypothetical protein
MIHSSTLVVEAEKDAAGTRNNAWVQALKRSGYDWRARSKGGGRDVREGAN